ncbi:MAG TPA: hypothetical protein VNE21_08470, partial [Mycobacteriales bacterium]|nr:hypothetical protein [Mycobacteriales bacterium]
VIEVVEGALDLGDVAKAEQYLDSMESLRPGETAPFFLAQSARLRARLAARRGDDGADGLLRDAATRFRRLGYDFWLAVTLLEHGEWLVAEGRSRGADDLLGEARAIFQRLGAPPWLERVGRAAEALDLPA